MRGREKEGRCPLLLRLSETQNLKFLPCQLFCLLTSYQLASFTCMNWLPTFSHDYFRAFEQAEMFGKDSEHSRSCHRMSQMSSSSFLLLI